MLPGDRRFKGERYLGDPIFSTAEGLAAARALCARFPKVSSALVKRAKDNLQQVADEADRALQARSRQTHLISAEDSTTLDFDMVRSWTCILMRLDTNTMLPPDEYPIAGRSEELINQMFYSEGPECFRDTYAAQLATMQRMLQRIEKDDLEAEFNELCGEPFLRVFRRMLPRYESVVNAMQRRGGEPIVNLLVHRNVLGRAIQTYATAICLTVIDYDNETMDAAYAALEPLDSQRMVTAGRGRPATSAPDLSPTWSAAEAPLPA